MKGRKSIRRYQGGPARRLFPAVAVLFLLVAALASCGGGGGGGDTSATPPQTLATVSGSVVKGPVSGASVTIYTLNADGSRRSYYGPITTDSDGNFSATLKPAPTGPLEVVSSGGSYVDEATGAITTLAAWDNLSAAWPAGTTRAVVTPLTDIAAARVWVMAARGTPSAAQLAEAIQSSNISVAQQYGIDNILATTPASVADSTRVATTTRAERNYGLVLAGIAQYAGTLGVRSIDLVGALATDAQGGQFNGSNDNAPITLPKIAGGTVALPAGAGTTNLQASINAFMGSSRNKSGLTQMFITPTPVQIGLNTAGTLYTTSTVLPAAISGRSYTAKVTATGGTPPYKCALKAGSTLPAGYSLVPDTCQIIGTGALLGGGTTITFSLPFTIALTDSATQPATVELTQYLTTDIPAPTLSATSGTGTAGTSFNLPAPTVAGGSPPYYFQFDTFLNGTPPLGATVDLFTGVVTVPATAKAGNYTFGVCAVDMGGRSTCTSTAVQVSTAPAGGGGYDGTYSGTFQTVSPLGTTSGPGTITVTNGYLTDPDGVFTGNVDSTGHFSGTWNYSQGSLPIPMSGVFSTSSSFTLSGTIGSTVRGTATLHKL